MTSAIQSGQERIVSIDVCVTGQLFLSNSSHKPQRRGTWLPDKWYENK